MILLVTDDPTGDRLASALEGESVRRVSTLVAARDALDEGAVQVVFVSGEWTDGSTDVRAALGGEAAPPTVAVLDAADEASARSLGVDDVVRRPFTDEGVREAVSRLERVDAYDQALGQLFALCRRRATSEAQDAPTRTELKSARDEADRHLRAAEGGEASVFERLLRS